jgi:hypothetical protein
MARTETLQHLIHLVTHLTPEPVLTANRERQVGGMDSQKTRLVTSDYPPTEGSVYSVPVVTNKSGDYLASKMPVVTSDYKESVVTSDYSPVTQANTETSKRGRRRPKKPKIPGCEVRNHEAGWNVFRVWYDKKKPGEKWPKKHRAYECYLTQSDVEKGLNYVTKKNKA